LEQFGLGGEQAGQQKEPFEQLLLVVEGYGE
jgi:hypothetical protein